MDLKDLKNGLVIKNKRSKIVWFIHAPNRTDFINDSTSVSICREDGANGFRMVRPNSIVKNFTIEENSEKVTLDKNSIYKNDKVKLINGDIAFVDKRFPDDYSVILERSKMPTSVSLNEIEEIIESKRAKLVDYYERYGNTQTRSRLGSILREEFKKESNDYYTLIEKKVETYNTMEENAENDKSAQHYADLCGVYAQMLYLLNEEKRQKQWLKNSLKL